MNNLSKYWWLALIRGIIFIILAILVIRQPLSALVGLSVYIAVTLLFTGISQTAISFISRDSLPNWGWGLAGGLFDIIFALILLSNPALTATTLPFVVGFWIIIYGIMTFVNSFQSKKDGASYWWMDLISGLLSVIVGYIIANNLIAGTLVITYWMGLGFILAGIVNIGAAFTLKKLQ